MWPRAWNINKYGVKQHRDRMHSLGEKNMKPKTLQKLNKNWENELVWLQLSRTLPVCLFSNFRFIT